MLFFKSQLIILLCGKKSEPVAARVEREKKSTWKLSTKRENSFHHWERFWSFFCITHHYFADGIDAEPTCLKVLKRQVLLRLSAHYLYSELCFFFFNIQNQVSPSVLLVLLFISFPDLSSPVTRLWRVTCLSCATMTSAPSSE